MVPKFKSNRVFLRKRKNEVLKSGQKMSQKSVKKSTKKVTKNVTKKVTKKSQKKCQKMDQKKDPKMSLFLRHFWCHKLDKKGTHF